MSHICWAKFMCGAPFLMLQHLQNRNIFLPLKLSAGQLVSCETFTQNFWMDGGI